MSYNSLKYLFFYFMIINIKEKQNISSSFIMPQKFVKDISYRLSYRSD